MSNSSRVALRAFRTVQRISGSPSQLRTSVNRLASQIPSSPRTFYTKSSNLAAASPEPSKPPAPSGARTDASLALDPTLASTPSIPLDETDPHRVDWSKSFHGLSQTAFPKEAADILLNPINPETIEVKPDGIIYLPEIHYRRILNKAFGPGAWGLAPRGETIVTDKAVTREYALVAHGRLVSIARGEQDYFSKDGIPTASEGCKSNAMVRCCKDLGIASELWDPRFVREWKAKYTREVFVEQVNTKRKTKIWLRKGDPVPYPFKELKGGAASPAP